MVPGVLAGLTMLGGSMKNVVPGEAWLMFILSDVVLIRSEVRIIRDMRVFRIVQGFGFMFFPLFWV